MHPTLKMIAGAAVTLDGQGWPHWTRIQLPPGQNSLTLDHEQARDLLYAMHRIVTALDRIEREAETRKAP